MASVWREDNKEIFDGLTPSTDLWLVEIENLYADIKDKELTKMDTFAILMDVTPTSDDWKSILLLGLEDNLAVIRHKARTKENNHE